jgi:hypothetical protein
MDPKIIAIAMIAARSVIHSLSRSLASPRLRSAFRTVPRSAAVLQESGGAPRLRDENRLRDRFHQHAPHFSGQVCFAEANIPEQA